MPKPKLLLVADTYYPQVDGTVKFIEEFIRRSKDDFDYHLLVPNFTAAPQKAASRVTFLDISKIFSFSGYALMKLSFRNLKKIRRAVKEADLVFVQGPALISMSAIFFSSLYHKKCVSYNHVNPWEFYGNFLASAWTKLAFYIFKPILRWSINSCSLTLVPYPELMEELIGRKVNIPIKVARLGVDIEQFSPAVNKMENKKKIGISPDKTVIGYVGRISPEKNVTTLLDAFKRLKKQEKFFLLMVGDGPKDQVNEFKRIPNCLVTGFVMNVEDYLQAMDIFVMPSLTETTSLATLEAMSCGLPVIATKVGFIKNYLTKEENGLFFPRKSSSLLAMQMGRLLQDRDLGERLGENARKTVAYSFSWERSINKIKKQLLQVYTE